MTLEEEVVELRAEVDVFRKYIETLDTLAINFNIHHNFLKSQFGKKFKEFCEKDGNDQCDDDEVVQLDQPNDNEQEEDDLAYNDEYEEGNEDEAGFEMHQVDDDGELDDEDEISQNQSDRLFPSQLLDVNVECVQDQYEDESMEPRNSTQIATVRPKVPGRVFPSSRFERNGQMRTASTSSAVIRKGIGVPSTSGASGGHPLPPLKRCPPPGQSVFIQRKGNNVIASSAAATRALQLALRRPSRTSPQDENDDEFGVNGTGTGKYAQFYRKVDSELIQCTLCKKILKRRGKFIQHLRTHTGEKPFDCPYCEARFSRKDNMNVHVSRHHADQQQIGEHSQSSNNSNNEELSTCEECGIRFISEEHLNSHLQTEHGYTYMMDGDSGGEESEQMYYAHDT